MNRRIKCISLVALVGILAVQIDSASARERKIETTRVEANHEEKENLAVIGIVEKTAGVSSCERPGRLMKAGVALGMRLFERDRLITKDSRLHVRFKDETYLEMGEHTSFGVERLRFKPRPAIVGRVTEQVFDETIFRFFYGVVRITAPEVEKFEIFSIKTANALLQVFEPADFYLVQLVGERDLSIQVAKGVVEIMNTFTNEKVKVSAGRKAVLKLSGLVSEAGPFTNPQLQFLKSRTGL
ncbi:MAG: hypothetical protein AB1540_09930 [Bdellovibrionota bacterium]